MKHACMIFCGLLVLSFAPRARGWDTISPEDLALQPPDWCSNADAMVLNMSKSYVMCTKRFVQSRATINGQHFMRGKGWFDVYTSVRIKIFTDRGKEEYGNVHLELPFNEILDDYTLKARTVTPSGKTIEVNTEKAFTKRLAESQSNLGRPREYAVAFPDVTAGSILELEYVAEAYYPWLIEPHYFDFNRLPTRSSVVSFHLPVTSEYALQPVNTEPFNFQSRLVTEQVLTEQGITLISAVSNVCIDYDLSLAPPEGFRRPYLCFIVQGEQFLLGANKDLSTWKNASRNVTKNFYDSFLIDRNSLKKVYARVLADSAGGLPLPARLYQWVCDSLEFVDTRNCYVVGYDEKTYKRNMTVNDRVKSGRATGAEKVLILDALYDLAGLDSKPLLIVPTNQAPAVSSIPVLAQFQTAILALEQDGKTWYLDPVQKGTPFGLVSYYHRGTWALPIDEDTDSCLAIPLAKDKNVIQYDLKCRLNPDGDLAAAGTLTFTNQYWYDFYHDLQEADSVALRRTIAAVSLDQVAPEQLATVRIEPDSGRSRKFVLHVEFSVKRFAQVVGNEMTFTPDCLTRVPSNLLPVDTARTEDVHFSFPRVSICNLEYELPDGYTPASEPVSMSEGGAAGLSYFATVSPSPDSSGLIYNRTYVRDFADYDVSGYEAIRTFLNTLAQHDAVEVVIRKGGTK